MRTLIFLLIFSISSLLHAEELSILPKTLLIIPENSSIKINWLIKPEDKTKKQDWSPENIQFVMAGKNNPIILYNGKYLYNPNSNYVVKFKNEIRSLLSLNNGGIIFSNGGELATSKVINSEKSSLPEAILKPFLKLPANNCDVYCGDDSSLFSVCYDEKNTKYEVFIFKPKSNYFEKILESQTKVNAVTGNFKRIFIATGKFIQELHNNKLNFLYTHPRDEIRGLYYSKEVGLFYKTNSGVGFIKNGRAIEFLQTNYPIVYLKGKSMFIFFWQVFGLAELTDIDDLNKYNYDVNSVKDIKVMF